MSSEHAEPRGNLSSFSLQDPVLFIFHSPWGTLNQPCQQDRSVGEVWTTEPVPSNKPKCTYYSMDSSSTLNWAPGDPAKQSEPVCENTIGTGSPNSVAHLPLETMHSWVPQTQGHDTRSWVYWQRQHRKSAENAYRGTLSSRVMRVMHIRAPLLRKLHKPSHSHVSEKTTVRCGS